MRTHRHGSPHQASLWISGVVAVSIVLAVVFKLDPAAQFYTWFAGATTVGFVVLLIATASAVLAFFARDRRGHSQWRVGIAPALGLVGLVGSLILILANLKDLVGGSSVLAWVIIGLLVGAFTLGAVDRHAGQRQDRRSLMTQTVAMPLASAGRNCCGGSTTARSPRSRWRGATRSATRRASGFRPHSSWTGPAAAGSRSVRRRWAGTPTAR